MIEESCFANSRGEVKLSLDRAKEASTKERSLIRLREQAGLSESHNLDLTFSVLFNLANQYAANDMYTEALNTYQVRFQCTDSFQVTTFLYIKMAYNGISELY